MADIRDPDSTQVIASLVDGLAALKANVISRWGRIPHVAADPTSPPDGSVWIRSDTGNLNWRANGTTQQSAWTAVTFAGTWVDFGAPWQVAQYRRRGDDVQIRGAIKSGTINTAAFTLPAGFRPPADLAFTADAAGALGILTVTSAGVVTPLSGGTTFFTINCQFSTTT